MRLGGTRESSHQADSSHLHSRPPECFRTTARFIQAWWERLSFAEARKPCQLHRNTKGPVTPTTWKTMPRSRCGRLRTESPAAQNDQDEVRPRELLPAQRQHSPEVRPCQPDQEFGRAPDPTRRHA